MKPTGGYITVTDRKNKPRLMCFKDIHTANKCKVQLAKFRAEKGNWPDMDLSSPHSAVQTKFLKKLRDPKEVLEFLEIDTVCLDDITNLARSNNLALLYCLNFNSKLSGNMLSMEFSAQEIDIEVDNFAYIRELNYNYYKSD
jgi:hypothetical protein